jgi:galactokinase/mevalonate kinase-like predicted kinase
MIHSSAPGRAGIVGNPTDGYGGTVISCSLAERAAVSLTPAETTVLDVCGCQETIRTRDDLRLTGAFTDVAKAVLLSFDCAVPGRPVHLKATTTIPMRAGLAGSTAMIAAILGAVLRLLEIDLNRYQIAESTRKIEFETMGVTCGFQDQYMAAFGGLHCLDFRGKDPHAATKEPIFATVEPLASYVGDLPMVLANTGVQRHSGTVHKGLRQRWIEGEEAVVQGYLRVAALARDAKKALLNGDWECLGAAMNENHAIQRALGGSGEANEHLIAAALAAGSWGAKLAGAGHGGTILALHPEPEVVAQKLEEAGAVHVMRLTPSEGLVVESEY